MAVNLEVRAPYLNKEMLDFTSRLPSSLKIRGLKRKYALKKAMEKRLPREIVWRKKAGFSAPIRAWLRGPLRPLVDDLLSPTAIKRRGVFNPQYVREMIAANDSGREDYNLQIFQLLNWEIFTREYFDR
jgi:asparagine synthase (glutamine-hydrolysing)